MGGCLRFFYFHILNITKFDWILLWITQFVAALNSVINNARTLTHLHSHMMTAKLEFEQLGQVCNWIKSCWSLTKYEGFSEMLNIFSLVILIIQFIFSWIFLSILGSRELGKFWFFQCQFDSFCYFCWKIEKKKPWSDHIPFLICFYERFVTLNLSVPRKAGIPPDLPEVFCPGCSSQQNMLQKRHW